MHTLGGHQEGMCPVEAVGERTTLRGGCREVVVEVSTCQERRNDGGASGGPRGPVLTDTYGGKAIESSYQGWRRLGLGLGTSENSNGRERGKMET